jgi:hypothetical protein
MGGVCVSEREQTAGIITPSKQVKKRSAKYCADTTDYLSAKCHNFWAERERKALELIALQVSKVEDNSDTAAITGYELQLHIKKVSLVDYEQRVKKFVYNSSTVTLRQLQGAFVGNRNLELILEDKNSLDWRIIFDENFLDQEANKDICLEELEDDPKLSFCVPNLILYGILYCQADPQVRIQKFYELVQHTLVDHISSGDDELAVFFPLMARICYTSVIIQYYED